MNSRSVIAAALLALSTAAPLPALADTTVVVEPQTAPPAPPEPSTGAVVITPAQPSADVQTCQETTTRTEDFAGSTTERTRTCVEGPSAGQ